MRRLTSQSSPVPPLPFRGTGDGSDGGATVKLGSPTPTKTVVSDPVVVHLDVSDAPLLASPEQSPASVTAGEGGVPSANLAQPAAANLAGQRANAATPAPEKVSGTANSSADAGARPAPPPQKPRPRRRKRVSVRHLMQAWGVSLVVHVVMLSALAAATFTLDGHDQEDRQF